MQYNEAYIFVENLLQKNTQPFYVYHNIDHTKDVILASTYLAEKEGIVEPEITILKTAALFHDVGYTVSHINHEQIGCEIAKNNLPKFGYNEAQISTICKLIISTKMPQSPTDNLSNILCDADLFYIGTNDYKEKSNKLYNELLKNKIVSSPYEWEHMQTNFFTNHIFFTNTARVELEDNKQTNLTELQKNIAHKTYNKKEDEKYNFIRDYIFILIGILLAGVALKGFLVPNKFFDGGLTGASLLLHENTHINLAVCILLLNLPFIIVSYFTISMHFAIKTLISVVLLGVCLWVLPSFPMTQDKLLIAIFGGVFLGAGVGLVMRAGSALDGMEVLALYTLKRTSFTITEIIFAFNILIFAIAALEYGIETALYSILTYFAASRTIDYVVEGLQAYTGLTIISAKSEVIKYQLVSKLGKGITVYKGERGFLPGKFEISADCDIIFTIVKRLELRRLKNMVYEIDPTAFVFANTIKEASGGVMKRKQGH